MERKNRKIYYTMGEVSEMFDVRPSLIRFWEQKFDILKPDKNRKGNRLFTPKDVENLKLIYHLVKENGMTLAGAAKRLRENKKGEERDLEVIEKLQGIRSLLLEVREELKTKGEEAVFVDEPLSEEEEERTLSVEEAETPTSNPQERPQPVPHDDEVIPIGPAVPRFLQREIPIPPQPTIVRPLYEELPDNETSDQDESKEDEPTPPRPTIIEQSLF